MPREAPPPTKSQNLGKNARGGPSIRTQGKLMDFKEIAN